MSTGAKVALGISAGVILAVVLLGIGCAALLGAGLGGVAEEVERESQRHAISNREARAIELGTSRSEVIDQLGQPRSTDESQIRGLGRSTCIYYDVEGGDLLSSWQMCFDGQGRLDHKSRI